MSDNVQWINVTSYKTFLVSEQDGHAAQGVGVGAFAALVALVMIGGLVIAVLRLIIAIRLMMKMRGIPLIMPPAVPVALT